MVLHLKLNKITKYKIFIIIFAGRSRELLHVESVEELKALDVRGIAGVILSTN